MSLTHPKLLIIAAFKNYSAKYNMTLSQFLTLYLEFYNSKLNKISLIGKISSLTSTFMRSLFQFFFHFQALNSTKNWVMKLSSFSIFCF